MGVGLFVLRRRRRQANLPTAEYRAWDIMAIFYTLINLYLLVMPWYPPPGGRNGGDVSFWYATYVVVGIALYVYSFYPLPHAMLILTPLDSLIMCALYYYAWIHVIPRWKGYRIRQEVLVLENGARANKLVKVPVEELGVWDRSHDATGHKISGGERSDSDGTDRYRYSEETDVPEATTTDLGKSARTRAKDTGVGVGVREDV